MIRLGNLYDTAPDVGREFFETILFRDGVVIERIVSRGHTTPWTEQGWDEWVMLVDGRARLAFRDEELTIGQGDFMLIPAGVRHRVVWTPPERETYWLAVHLRGERVTSCSCYEIWRQDDNGRRTCVDVFSDRPRAEMRESVLSGSGHRQTYWIEEIVKMRAD